VTLGKRIRRNEKGHQHESSHQHILRYNPPPNGQ